MIIRVRGRTDNGQKVNIIAHPELCSGELKCSILYRLNDIFLFKFPLYYFQNGKIQMSFKRHIISFKRHNFCFHFHSTLIVVISFLLNIGKEMPPSGFRCQHNMLFKRLIMSFFFST